MGKNLKGKELGKGISQRKDGRYEARVVVDGKRISIYNNSLTELKKEFEKRKQINTNHVNTPNCKTLLQDWYNKWFEICKSPNLKSDVSRNVYNRKIKNTYIKILGSKYISQLTQLDIQNATNELFTNGYRDRTIKEALGILRECMDSAIANNIINVNPCINIAIKKTFSQNERRVLSKHEQDLFLNEVKNTYYYEAYAILLLTGMRIGEFSGLQWEDVDFVHKVIHINRSMQTEYFNGKKIEELTTPKTDNSYRDIPFFGETEQLFKNWKIKQDERKRIMGDRWRCKPEHGNLVFTSTLGSPVTRYVLTHDLNKVVQNINMKEIYLASKEGRQPIVFEHLHPHAFRHTFATRCFEKKMEPILVQKIMGHSNYNTTVSYTHILDNVVANEVSKVGNFLS